MPGIWPPKSRMKGGPKTRKGDRLYYSPPPLGGGGPGEVAGLLGAELVSTGDFAADASWTKDAGWTIAGGVGVATATATNAFIHQAVAVVTNGFYRLTFTVATLTSGNVRASFDNGPLGTIITATGTYTEDFTMKPGTVSEIRFGRGTADFSGTIDNVSLKRIGS